MRKSPTGTLYQHFIFLAFISMHDGISDIPKEETSGNKIFSDLLIRFRKTQNQPGMLPLPNIIVNKDLIKKTKL